mmetsp:Transcript_20989/g.59541  ORF Transcript_20989/g.59541 Transcript_20989/m.59541 type:complete len:410 (-) Transcript_20989:1-1230(-)
MVEPMHELERGGVQPRVHGPKEGRRLPSHDGGVVAASGELASDALGAEDREGAAIGGDRGEAPDDDLVEVEEQHPPPVKARLVAEEVGLAPPELQAARQRSALDLLLQALGVVREADEVERHARKVSAHAGEQAVHVLRAVARAPLHADDGQRGCTRAASIAPLRRVCGGATTAGGWAPRLAIDRERRRASPGRRIRPSLDVNVLPDQLHRLLAPPEVPQSVGQVHRGLAAARLKLQGSAAERGRLLVLTLREAHAGEVDVGAHHGGGQAQRLPQRLLGLLPAAQGGQASATAKVGPGVRHETDGLGEVLHRLLVLPNLLQEARPLHMQHRHHHRAAGALLAGPLRGALLADWLRRGIAGAARIVGDVGGALGRGDFSGNTAGPRKDHRMRYRCGRSRRPGAAGGAHGS